MAEGNIKLEQEIAQLEQALASKKAALDQGESARDGEVPSEKEIIREVIGKKIQTASPAITPLPPASQPALPPIQVDPPSYLSPELKDKVQEFVGLAFSKSIDAAIKEAKATGNAALVDAFHDALVDELYQHLLDRGKLRKF